jgi:pyruvate formate lyase activating enzyme
METGVVFDIQEFAVHDGPGVRTTVFLKGCPLRCSWCHNPEGLSPEPQIMHSAGGDRLVGKSYTSEELAAILNRQADILRANEGGVTFSGGEPLMQARFVAEVMDLLKDIHILLDTSGYGSEDDFRALAGRSDMVYFDLKLMSPEAHRQYTGCGNKIIFSNLHVLSEMDVPYVVRIPLVPGITDTAENLRDIAAAVSGLRRPVRIDLLPYNRAAGGKYRSCGMDFKPKYDENRPPNSDIAAFEALGVEVKVL